MARHPITDPEAAWPVARAANSLRILPETPAESDFADLAARFSAASGGGLSAALSADLALQIVLNEIVEQACLATGATGAALALQRDSEYVCSATSGSTTPELGSRLSATAGLSGECVRTRQPQTCNDILADARLEVQLLQRHGARSVSAMPLLHGKDVVGIFAVFSSRPAAFGERDERTLEALSRRAVTNLERAASQPKESPAAASPAVSEMPAAFPEAREDGERNSVPASPSDNTQPGPHAVSRPQGSQVVRRGFDVATWVMGAAVLFCAVLLAFQIGRHLGGRRQVQRLNRPAPVVSQTATQTATQTTPVSPSVPSTADVAPPTVSRGNADAPSTVQGKSKDARSDGPVRANRSIESAEDVPPGGLSVYQNGKEVFRLVPNQSGTQSPRPSVSQNAAPTQIGANAAADRAVGVQSAASLEPEKARVVELSFAEAERSLLHRVEPDYPDVALQQHIQGQVLLDVRIGVDGSVQGLRVASGPAQLAQAATDAVRQWRFRPRSEQGTPVAVQTTVTLSFRLPQ
jgi:TonB family protein